MTEDFFAESKEPTYSVELTANKNSTRTANEGHLIVDVYQTEDEIVVQSLIAGANRDNLDIQVTTEMVTIKGRRDRGEEVKSSDFYHRELFWGPFSRAVILPVDVDADSAKASYKNGILTIRLPKLEKVRTKKLKISE